MSMKDSKVLRGCDRKIGTLLCWIISIFIFLNRMRRTKTGFTEPKKILFIEIFEMGAAIMLSPSMKWVSTQFPQAELHCLTSSSCAGIWKELNLIPSERIHTLDSSSSFKLMISLIRKIIQLRKERFDLAIDYEPFMRISAILAGLIGSRSRAGFHKYLWEGLDRGGIYDRKCSYNQNTHISKNYLALTLSAVTNATDYPNLKASLKNELIHITPTRKKPSLERLRAIFKNTAVRTDRYFVICPDVGKILSMRNYPPAQFAQVIELLIKQYADYSFVFIGTENEKETLHKILSRLEDATNCINMMGKTDLNELLDVIAGAELVLTNDNGPAHFAALTDTKVVTLFSTDSPFVYGPLGRALISYSFYHCSPCILATNQKSSRCTDNKCLQAIPPGEVFQLIQKAMGANPRFNLINDQIPYLF